MEFRAKRVLPPGLEHSHALHMRYTCVTHALHMRCSNKQYIQGTKMEFSAKRVLPTCGALMVGWSRV